MAFPILSVLVFVPAAGALLVGLIPGARRELAKPVALIVALVELGLAAYLIVEFKTNTAGFQFVTSHLWFKLFGISWHLGVDGISLFLVAMTALLFPIAMFGPRITGDPKAFLGWMLLLEAACVGSFLALDLFVFFIMFEITLVPAYFLVAGWGGPRRSYAAFKFFLYTFSGSAFLLVGMLALVVVVGQRTGHYSFDLITLARGVNLLPHSTQTLLFLAFALAFVVKIPLVPFHTWLPDAYTEANASGSMVLAGILFKLGAYGILRFGLYLFPRAAVDLAPLLLTLAVIGITYGAIVAALQRDYKRLIAYGTIADVGFIIVGYFGFTTQGLTGSVLEMVNHGLITGALFFLLGMLWERRKTYAIRELGGVQKALPILTAVFLFVILGAVGLPGLNGFVGEFLVLSGTFLTHRWWAVVGTTGVILSVIYMLWGYQRVFHGVARTEVVGLAPGAGGSVPSGGGSVSTGKGGAGASAVRDMTRREMWVIAPLLVGMVFLGVYPQPFLRRVEPSVDALLAHVHYADHRLHVPAGGTPRVRYAVPADQNVNIRPATSHLRVSAGSHS